MKPNTLVKTKVMAKLKPHTILDLRKLDTEGETICAHRERVLSPLINKLERQLQLVRENQEDTPNERDDGGQFGQQWFTPVLWKKAE